MTTPRMHGAQSCAATGQSRPAMFYRHDTRGRQTAPCSTHQLRASGAPPRGGGGGGGVEATTCCLSLAARAARPDSLLQSERQRHRHAAAVAVVAAPAPACAVQLPLWGAASACSVGAAIALGVVRPSSRKEHSVTRLQPRLPGSCPGGQWVAAVVRGCQVDGGASSQHVCVGVGVQERQLPCRRTGGIRMQSMGAGGGEGVESGAALAAAAAANARTPTAPGATA